MKTLRRALPSLALATALSCGPTVAWGATPAKAATEPDLEAARELNATCAGCHGELGQGGKRGEYPRIAGLNQKYLADQLRKFRSRERVNIPMVPYTEPRELSDADILNVSTLLAGIKLSSKIPDFKPTDDALTRLKAMDKVMKIPRAEGNVAAGEPLYRERCQSCHGNRGQGRGAVFPPLAGQYTQYLQRQIGQFMAGTRTHDEEKKDILAGLKPDDVRNILAFVSTIEND